MDLTEIEAVSGTGIFIYIHLDQVGNQF